jgi:hypothetical protein
MRRDRRKASRIGYDSPTRIYALDGQSTHPCVLSDLSTDGAKITGVLASVIPNEFMLRIPHRGSRRCRVLWRLPFELGVEFTDHVINAEETDLQCCILEAAE